MTVTISIDEEVEVYVECDDCRSTLTASYNAHSSTMYVSPCTVCIEKNANESYTEGLDDGRNERKD